MNINLKQEGLITGLVESICERFSEVSLINVTESPEYSENKEMKI
jgi:hypothetical protein